MSSSVIRVNKYRREDSYVVLWKGREDAFPVLMKTMRVPVMGCGGSWKTWGFQVFKCISPFAFILFNTYEYIDND